MNASFGTACSKRQFLLTQNVILKGGERCVIFVFAVYQIELRQRLLSRPLVPNLAVYYPNWVMGHFDLDNGLFFYYTVIEKLGQEKQVQSSH